MAQIAGRTNRRCVSVVIFFILSVLITTASTARAASVDNYMPGDVDGNGIVESADARLALRASVQLERYSQGSPSFSAADVDQNCMIEASDARMILRASVKIEELPSRWHSVRDLSAFVPETETWSVWADMPDNSVYTGSPAGFSGSVTAAVSWNEAASCQVLKIAETVYITCPEENQLLVGQLTPDGAGQRWMLPAPQEIPAAPAQTIAVYAPEKETWSVWADMPDNSVYIGASAGFSGSVTAVVDWNTASSYLVMKISGAVYITSPEADQSLVGQLTPDGAGQKWMLPAPQEVPSAPVMKNYNNHVELAVEGGALMSGDGSIADTYTGHYLYRRSEKILRINDSVELVFDPDDYQQITGYSIWQYKTVDGRIVYDSRIGISNPPAGENRYLYSRKDGIDYIKLTFTPTVKAQKRKFRPVQAYSDHALSLCCNPNISGAADGAVSFSYDVGDGVWTRGSVLLPPNYSVDGKPVPLHVFCHGTGGMIQWDSSITADYLTTAPHIDLKEWFSYQTNEGFAVFDCYPWTSKHQYKGRRISPFILPIHEQAYVQGIKYVCSRFNVDIDSVCVSGFSLGGNLSYWFAHQNEIPVKAVAMLAPTSHWASPLFKQFFLEKNGREGVVEALGLSEKDGATEFIDTQRGLTNESVKAFVQSNLREFAGLTPCELGVSGMSYQKYYDLSITPRTKIVDGVEVLDGSTPEWMLDIDPTIPDPPAKFTEKGALGLPKIIEHPELSSYAPVPIKYWQAFDDENVSAYSNFAAYIWLLNGGSQVYWRTMANGHGGHRAMGYTWGKTNEENGFRFDAETTTRITRLGIKYTADNPVESLREVPVVPVEMIHFFCDCLGIDFNEIQQ